jgi:selenocysteine lyase/cysteine desulfurase
VAQTAGVYPIDVERDGIDLLAFLGHKSFYGPQGTGGLVIGERVREKEMAPLRQGGTGSRSEFEEQSGLVWEYSIHGTKSIRPFGPSQSSHPLPLSYLQINHKENSSDHHQRT